MPSYTIYLIPRRKVGCTTNLAQRMAEYRCNWDLPKPWPYYRVLEVLHDVTATQAGDREWYYADKYGLPRGPHYTATLHANHLPNSWLTQSPDQRSTAGRKGGPVGGFKMRATCPHCGRIGQFCGMRRWHFDNCRDKPLAPASAPAMWASPHWYRVRAG